ncbi:hypothetical protein HK405_005857, partial [Cladochytrium tenue]
SPLGRGFLTGQITSTADLAESDNRRRHPRFEPDNVAKNLALVDSLRAIAAAKGVTPAQLALAWVMGRSATVPVIPIPGTRNIKRVDENWAAKDVVLTAEEEKAIRAIIDGFTVAGTRYPESAMKGVMI